MRMNNRPSTRAWGKVCDRNKRRADHEEGGSDRGVFAVGWKGRAKRPESGDKSCFAACAHGDHCDCPRRANSGSQSCEGEKADDRSLGGTGKKDSTGQSGREISRAESEGQSELGSEEGVGGGEAQSGQDQGGSGKMAGRRMSAWVYVLQCRDGSFYTGWTNDLEKRVRTHQTGRGGKYTRSRLPLKLVRAWKKKNRKEAMRAEALFKQLTRKEKIAKLRGLAKRRTSARVRSRAGYVTR